MSIVNFIGILASVLLLAGCVVVMVYSLGQNQGTQEALRLLRNDLARVDDLARENADLKQRLDAVRKCLEEWESR